ncbi:MAG: helix-turn-helix domain-containing protein [Lactobacillaceae bacterium]|jgi:transcriptional regulator with XRE-family HTH domain|nr:helix-turn-helix domain-containing protein [Lactobacillaceae bacterium]
MEEIIFPNQIRMYRRLRGCSMQELADHLAVSLSAISKIEKGYRRVDQEQLVRIAEFLDCPLQDLFVNEQNSQPEVIQSWRREQERRNKINEKSGLKTLGAGLRQIRNDKNLTLIEVAESSDMTLSVYHRIEMGQREVSDKEFKNVAKALSMQPDALKDAINNLEQKGALEEIIQRNDAKYKLLSSKSSVSSFNNGSQDIKIPVFGVAGKDGDIIIDLENETKKVVAPYPLQNKKDAYAINLCTRRLGTLLPSRSVLFVNPQEAVSVGDIAVYYKDEEVASILSIRENEKGQIYGLRWNPDEKVEIDNNNLNNLHKVVAIYL